MCGYFTFIVYLTSSTYKIDCSIMWELREEQIKDDEEAFGNKEKKKERLPIIFDLLFYI